MVPKPTDCFDRLQLSFRHDEPAGLPGSGADNLITLSEAFYDEIDQHRIPVEREVVALLANAPGVLDLYVWLVWKTAERALRSHSTLRRRGSIRATRHGRVFR